MEVIRCLAIRPDFSWSVYVCGVMVNQKLCTGSDRDNALRYIA